jgi:hypothetical protein
MSLLTVRCLLLGVYCCLFIFGICLRWLVQCCNLWDSLFLRNFVWAWIGMGRVAEDGRRWSRVRRWTEGRGHGTGWGCAWYVSFRGKWILKNAFSLRDDLRPWGKMSADFGQNEVGLFYECFGCLMDVCCCSVLWCMEEHFWGHGFDKPWEYKWVI